jgi:hypothetical protein
MQKKSKSFVFSRTVQDDTSKTARVEHQKKQFKRILGDELCLYDEHNKKSYAFEQTLPSIGETVGYQVLIKSILFGKKKTYRYGQVETLLENNTKVMVKTGHTQMSTYLLKDLVKLPPMPLVRAHSFQPKRFQENLV